MSEGNKSGRVDSAVDSVVDYVIVGGGSAGCIVAGRLAQAGAQVMVLEAGGTDRRLDVLIPAAVGSAYQKLNWKLPVEPDASRANRPESWPAGKVLGGGGSINSCVFVRGNRADFDGWAAQGCTGWDYESVLPSFRRLETWERGADSLRGGEGPISVCEQTYSHVGNDAFLQAGIQAGYQRTFDYNGAQQEGIGITQTNQRRGTRSQSSRGYLRHLAPKRNLEVKTSAFVSRVLFDQARAVGVEYRHGGQLRQVRAREEVIMSAGAMTSPKLLMLSGVGPRNTLQAKGIEVISDNPGVGMNLQDHPNVYLRWHSRVPTINDPRLRTKVQAAAQYAKSGRGALAMTYFHVLVFFRTDPALDAPNFQIGFSPFAISRETDETGMIAVAPSQDEGLMITAALVRPHGRGHVSLRSAAPEDPPLIEHRYFGHPDDLREIVAGAAEARRIMAQPAMADLIGPMFESEGSCRSDDDWVAWMRDTAASGAHSSGTCKMGVDDLAVVDPELKVRGVRGLRVVDASIMPTVTTGNTNAPTMMIAERAARLILGEP